MDKIYTPKATKNIISETDNLFEVIKKIKSYRNRYLTKMQKVEEAEAEVTAVKQNLQAATEAIMKGEGADDLSLADLQRKIKSAEGRREKAIERNREDIQAVDGLVQSLIDALMESVEVAIPEEEDADEGELGGPAMTNVSVQASAPEVVDATVSQSGAPYPAYEGESQGQQVALSETVAPTRKEAAMHEPMHPEASINQSADNSDSDGESEGASNHEVPESHGAVGEVDDDPYSFENTNF